MLPRFERNHHSPSDKEKFYLPIPRISRKPDDRTRIKREKVKWKVIRRFSKVCYGQRACISITTYTIIFNLTHKRSSHIDQSFAFRAQHFVVVDLGARYASARNENRDIHFLSLSLSLGREGSWERKSTCDCTCPDRSQYDRARKMEEVARVPEENPRGACRDIHARLAA